MILLAYLFLGSNVNMKRHRIPRQGAWSCRVAAPIGTLVVVTYRPRWPVHALSYERANSSLHPYQPPEVFSYNTEKPTVVIQIKLNAYHFIMKDLNKLQAAFQGDDIWAFLVYRKPLRTWLKLYTQTCLYGVRLTQVFFHKYTTVK